MNKDQIYCENCSKTTGNNCFRSDCPKILLPINNQNYHQEIEQSDEEKFAMYMKLSKEELVKMLIEANKIISNRKPSVKVLTPTNTVFVLKNLKNLENPKHE